MDSSDRVDRGAPMKATLKEVAERAGVSIKTVSNVVNGFPHVSEMTRARVVQAIDALEYQPNLSARSLRTGRTDVLCLAIPELRFSYFAELADAIIKEARVLGMNVQIEQTNGDREHELALLSSARLQLTDGLILSPLGLSNDDAGLIRAKVPIVLLGERVFDTSVDHVTMMNTEAACAMTEHLIDIGCRRIAVIGDQEHGTVGSGSLRIDGYRRALARAGIAYDARLVVRADRWERENGATAVRELLSRGVGFDAVFGLNDTLAIGAIRTLQAAGISIPGDVAVAGFDDLDESRYSVPSLTTVDGGMKIIAREAVALAVRNIELHREQAVRHELIEVPFSLVLRESTARKPRGHRLLGQGESS
jgi:DNA-binding LacI/PurR family transcriptional regulator